jgi:hypothetical protein
VCIYNSYVMCIDGLSLADDQTYIIQHKWLSLQQNSRIPPISQHLSFHFSAGLSRTSAHDKPTQMAKHLHCLQLCRLLNTSITDLTLLLPTMTVVPMTKPLISQLHVCYLHDLPYFLTSVCSLQAKRGVLR